MTESSHMYSLRVSTTLFVSVVIFILFMFIFPYTTQFGDSLIILAFSISVLFSMLIGNLWDLRPRPVHLFFCIYMIFYYLLPGYLHTAYGHFPDFGAGYSPAQVLSASTVVACFLICFFVGYIMDFPARGGAPRVTIPGRLLPVTVFCVAASLIAAAMLGFGNILATLRERNLENTAPSPNALMLAAIAHACSFYAFMFGIILFRAKKSTLSPIIVLLTFSLFLVFNSPLSVTRFVIGSYIISIFLVLLRFNRMQKFVIAVALVVAQFGLFEYISYLSRGDLNTEFNWSPIENFIANPDFDGFQSTINVAAMHDELGGKRGVNLASAILFFIPRPFWPQKSPGTGGEAAIYEGYPMYNISSPLPSEFYIDFGMPGVIVLSLLFGFFVRLSDDYFMHFKETSDVLGQVLVATAAGYIFIILRGALVGTLGPCAFSLAVSAICRRYSSTPDLISPGGETGVVRCRSQPTGCRLAALHETTENKEKSDRPEAGLACHDIPRFALPASPRSNASRPVGTSEGS
jgi:oligosaccharide repeat unit polymerase